MARDLTKKEEKALLDECVRMYIEDGLSFYKIAEKTGFSRYKIARYIRKKIDAINESGEQAKFEYNPHKYVSDEQTKEYVLIDKKDASKVLTDVNNEKGDVSKYLLRAYGIRKPKERAAVLHYQLYGEYWYEPYFDVVLIRVDDKRVHRTRNYWYDKEHCKSMAMTCRNKTELIKKSTPCYSSIVRNGWLKEAEAEWFSRGKCMLDTDATNHCVYVYEFPEQNTCYVGLTMRMKQRHAQHINGIVDKDGERIYDSVHKFCEEYHIENPEYKILESGLTALQSQAQEEYWLNKYQDEGWNTLNQKAVGMYKSSLGGYSKWDYESCKQEASKWKTKMQFRDNAISAYNMAWKNHWLDEFFPDSQSRFGHWNSFKHCQDAARYFNNVEELKKYYLLCYESCVEHGFLESLKFRPNFDENETKTDEESITGEA